MSDILPAKSPLSSPWGALAERLRPLLGSGATVGKTPMVPIHRETLAEIVHQLDEAHRR